MRCSINSESLIRILVVDDEPAIRSILRGGLEQEGYEVSEAGNKAELLRCLERTSIDLITLDLDLGGENGLLLAREVRAQHNIPIIMITGKADAFDRVAGLEQGADDYIVKPFSVPELLARVRALLRRAKPERMADVLVLGEIELDRVKKRVLRSGRDIELGPTEYRLLEFLMERPGRVFTREQLLDGVWGSEVYIDERTVDVHVGRLRKALNRGNDNDPIRTVRGSGYSIDDRFGKIAS